MTTPTREQAIDALDQLIRSAYYQARSASGTPRDIVETLVAHLSDHPEQAAALGFGPAVEPQPEIGATA